MTRNLVHSNRQPISTYRPESEFDPRENPPNSKARCRVATSIPMNWEAEEDMDRDLEENGELYKALAASPDDE